MRQSRLILGLTLFLGNLRHRWPPQRAVIRQEMQELFVESLVQPNSTEYHLFLIC